MRVKICGITRLKDALKAIELGAWALGFIFYKKSPRYISPPKAKRIIEQLPPFITTVGVFVNEKKSNVLKIAEQSGVNALQFHGDESPAFCQGFKKYKVIKAVRLNGQSKASSIGKYKTDALLFDTFDKDLFGGSGKTFDWSLVKRYKGSKMPVVLSGGLNSRNIKSAIKVHPYALDLSSGVETAPGIKSEKLMKKLFANIKDTKNA